MGNDDAVYPLGRYKSMDRKEKLQKGKTHINALEYKEEREAGMIIESLVLQCRHDMHLRLIAFEG